MDRKAHNATHFQGGCSKEVEQIICNLQGGSIPACSSLHAKYTRVVNTNPKFLLNASIGV